MSAAKMVADSTQSDLPEKTTKKRKKETLKKKVKKKKTTVKKGKKKFSEDEFDEADLDLENEVKPIGHFVKDREELVRQLFHCVKGTSLRRALPDVLKELPLEDLQRRCLEQIEVMSKKRIRRIIAGDDPATISSSGTEDETSEEEPEIDSPMYGDDDGETMETGEGEMADSTSQYADQQIYSDLEYDEHEEGSLGHSSRSLTPSDGLIDRAPVYQEEESTNSEVYQDYYDDGTADDSQPQPEQQPQYPPRDSDDETEEGEVTDDAPADNSPPDKEESAEVAAEPDAPAETVEAVEAAVDPTEVIKETGTDKPAEAENDLKTDNDNENDKKDDPEKASGEEKQEVTESKPEANEEEKTDAGDKDKDKDVVEGGDQTEMGEDKAEEPGSSTSNRVVLPPSTESLAPVLTQNQMELLELEMRARAIRAMLKTAK